MTTASQKCPRCGADDFAVLFGGSDRLYHTTSGRFQVVECSHCGLLQLYPRPSPEEQKNFYPERYWWAPDETAVGWLEGLYRNLVLADHVRFVWPGVERRQPVLDIGCGGGSFLAALRKRGARGVGLDLAHLAARVAWRRNSIPALCAHAHQAPFPSATFGAVTLFHVLEHLAEPHVLLEAVHPLMRDDGRLYVQVPNASCWQFLLFGELWSGVDIPRHLIHFRAEDVAALVEECGFRVLRRKFFSLRDNPAGLATSLAPQLEPMSRRARQVRESAPGRLLRNALYLSLVGIALPFTMLEAACGAGSTVMIEAVKT